MTKHLIGLFVASFFVSSNVVADSADRQIAANEPIQSDKTYNQSENKGVQPKYFVVVKKNPITWEQARDEAVSLGGHLATITSAVEQKAVWEAVSKVPESWVRTSNNYYLGPWLGGIQNASAKTLNGGWGWVTDEPFEYKNWRSGQPNNSGIKNALIFIGKNERSPSWADYESNPKGTRSLPSISAFVVENTGHINSEEESNASLSGLYGPKQYLTVLNNRATTLCASLAVTCKEVIVETADAWLKEAMKQSVDNMSARLKFEMLFSNPGALATDTERLALFEEVVRNDKLSKGLSAKLNSEFLARKDIDFPKLDAEAIQNIASDVALDIITELAIDSFADYIERSGDQNTAYWIRTVAKPSVDITTLAKGLAGGTITTTSASVGAGVIWAKNIYSFIQLGAGLNADKAAARDIESQLRMLEKQNASIIESLRTGETRGVIFEEVFPPRNITIKEKGILEDQLVFNNANQIELLKSQAVLDKFDWVVQGATSLAAKLGLGSPEYTYSGLEHANSTASLPGDIEATSISKPTQSSVVTAGKNEEVKSNHGLVFDFPLYEETKLKVEGKDCYIYAPNLGQLRARYLYAPNMGQLPALTSVRWSGNCVDSLPVGDGRILWMSNNRVDWIDHVGEEHGLVFRNGKLYIDKDLSESDIQYTCERVWRYARVYVPKETKQELFQNSWLTYAIAERVVEELVEKCPLATPSWSSQKTPKYYKALIEIHIPGNKEKYIWGLVQATAEGETLNWKHFDNLMIKAVTDDIKNIDNAIREEERREVQARNQQIAEQRKLAEARRQAEAQAQAQAQAAAAQQILNAEIAGIKKHIERLFEDGVGTPEELATALQIDEHRTLERLELGLLLDVQTVTGVQTIKHGGGTYYSVNYRARSLINAVVEKHRLERMNNNFSWNDWFDQTSSYGKNRVLNLTCLYDSVSDIPKQKERVKTKLVSFNSGGNGYSNDISIILECGKKGWWD